MGTEKLSFASVSEALKRVFGDLALFGQSGESSGFQYVEQYPIRANLDAPVVTPVEIKPEPQTFHVSRDDSSISSQSESSDMCAHNETYYNSYNGNSNGYRGKFRNHQRFYKPIQQKNYQTNVRQQNQYKKRQFSSNNQYQNGKKPKFEGAHPSRDNRQPSVQRTKNGDLKRCLICDSIMHVRDNCPHRDDQTLLQSCFVDESNELWKPLSDDFEYTSTFLLSHETFSVIYSC